MRGLALITYHFTTTVTINANADAFVDSGKPTTNYGSEANLFVSLYGSPVNVQHTLAQFSLAAIPSGTTIDEARFELYLNSASDLAVVNLGLGRNVASWKESDVVFSSRPGCPPTGASGNVGTTSGWYGWDVTALVSPWVQGNYGLRNQTAAQQADEQTVCRGILASDEPAMRL